MAGEGQAAVKARTAPDPDDPRKPDDPTEVKPPGWKYTAKSAWAEFNRDQCTDLAAGLTYYSVLSLFPALLALISLLGVFGQGQSTVNALMDLISQAGVSDVEAQLRPVLTEMVSTERAGFALVAGMAGALWSASGYVNGFGRALNRIYQVDEGRPFWKLRPLMLAITVLLVIMSALVMVGLVVSGPLARSVGEVIGLGSTTVTVWNIAKWPVILAIVVLMVAVLYYATPNVKQPKFRWISVGALFGIVTWVLGSLAFGFYVSQFGSYNKTYGSLAGVVVFLLWLWLTNLALLFGAEIDAELERARQLQAGIEAERTLQLPPRDDKKSKKASAKLEQKVAEGAQLRRTSGESKDPGEPAGRGRDAKDTKASTRDTKRAEEKEKQAKKKSSASEDGSVDAAADSPLVTRPATPAEQPVTAAGFVGMLGLVATRAITLIKRQRAG